MKVKQVYKGWVDLEHEGKKKRRKLTGSIYSGNIWICYISIDSQFFRCMYPLGDITRKDGVMKLLSRLSKYYRPFRVSYGIDDIIPTNILPISGYMVQWWLDDFSNKKTAKSMYTIDIVDILYIRGMITGSEVKPSNLDA